MARSYSECMGLEVEAERLVRCGVSRAEVSVRLGVHPQTLAAWALRGRWRKKDLDMERSAEIAREVILLIRNGNNGAARQKEQRARLEAAMREAVGLLADGGEEALAKLDRMLAGMESPKRLPAPKVELGPDPKMGHWRSLGDGDPDRAMREPMLAENGEVWTPEVQKRLDAEERAYAMRGGPRRRRDRNE
jgi:hypothetical protein